VGGTHRSHLGKTNREAVGILADCGGEDVNRWDFAGRAHHEYSSFFRLAPGRLLFGPTPHDPLTLGFGTGALAMVACAAGYILALRASRLDPIAALVIE